MRMRDDGDSVQLWLSEQDIYEWVRKPGAAWPCSDLDGHRLFAAFDTDGLYDIALDGKYGERQREILNNASRSNEFNAITSDFLKTILKQDHPCYFVTVGHFQGERVL
jgi:hypothetical protein